MWTGSKDQVHTTWMETVARQDPGDLPVLARHLGRASRIQCEERVGALAAWPPQRAVFDVLLRVLSDPPFASLETKPLHVTAMAGLILHASPGCSSAVSGVISEGRMFSQSPAMQDWFEAILDQTLGAVQRAEAEPHAIEAVDPERLQRALAERDVPTVRAAWSSCREPALGRWLEEMSGGSGQLKGSWAKVARTADPSVLPALLANPPKQAHALLRGCEHLLAFPPDPRIGRFLARAVVDDPKLGANALAFSWFVLCMLRHGDGSAADRWATVPGLQARYAGLAAELRRRGERRADPALDEVLQPLRSGAGPTSDGPALLARIHEDPTDLAQRSVYMDHALQQGDVRGDLLALQLARLDTGEPATERERRLVEANLDALLGGLADVVDAGAPVRFERGFPTEVFLNPYTGARVRKLQEAEGHPDWNTVERMHWGEAVKGLEPSVLNGLVELDGVSGRWVKAFFGAERLPRLERLGFTGGLTAPLLPILKTMGLRALRITGFRSGLFKQKTLLDWAELGLDTVETLGLPEQPAVLGLTGDADAWLDALPKGLVVEIIEGAGWQVHGSHHGWWPEVPRLTVLDRRRARVAFESVEHRRRPPPLVGASFEEVTAVVVPTGSLRTVTSTLDATVEDEARAWLAASFPRASHHVVPYDGELSRGIVVFRPL